MALLKQVVCNSKKAPLLTPDTQQAARPGDRFSRLEDPESDFPFYNGVPAPVSSRQWLFVMAMVVIGFLVLALPIPWPSGTFWQFVPAVLMPGIPLAALAFVTGRRSSARWAGAK